MAKTVKKVTEDKYSCLGEKNPFVAIPASLAGIFLATSLLWIIFAKDSLALLVPVLWGFVVLGIVALILSYKSQKA